MAQRRMFSLKVVDTDNFLMMPISSRLLYYDLAMRADDDGFVDCPKKIMKMIGCSDDDLKVLISKQYLIPFETGVCVIKHWNIHNLIRHDRYTETECKDEKKLVKKIDNKYEIIGTLDVIPDGNQATTQDRLVKVRKGKVKLDKENKNIYGELNNVYLLQIEYDNLIKDYGTQVITKYINSLSLYEKIDTYTDHNRAIRRWLHKDKIKKLQEQKPVPLPVDTTAEFTRKLAEERKNNVSPEELKEMLKLNNSLGAIEYDRYMEELSDID